MGERQGPQRRLRMKLNIEADGLDELAHRLTEISTDLLIDGREERDVVSGGGGAGYSLRLTCDESMTGDKYRTALREWVRGGLRPGGSL